MLWQRYYKPRSVPEALEVLAAEGGKARLVAGATDVSVRLKRGELEVDALVDITSITDLDYLRQRGDMIEIGALTTHSQATSSELVQQLVPVLAEACSLCGSPQVRNLGTLVGNIVNAQPCAVATTALMALDAELVIACRDGERRLPVCEACLGPSHSAVDPTSEIVTHIEFKLPKPNSGSAYERLAQRQSLVLPVVAVATRVTLDETRRTFEDAHIVVGPVAPGPTRMRAAEDSLRGATVSRAAIEQAAELASRDANPRGSRLRGGGKYRKDMVAVMVGRALIRAVRRAGVDV